MLDNLLANALDAVPVGGRVRIGTAPTSGLAGQPAVELRVVDDGPGMTSRARESAFRRFGNPEAGGTGLGWRAPPGHRERRHRPAGGQSWRRTDRGPGTPAPAARPGPGPWSAAAWRPGDPPVRRCGREAA
ncbi:sensor histidine kinase [Streptacidiphilus sp. 4-A2]|nr:sensor histidine kinase [Streptacidiphilus sp. 4-A2]